MPLKGIEIWKGSEVFLTFPLLGNSTAERLQTKVFWVWRPDSELGVEVEVIPCWQQPEICPQSGISVLEVMGIL